MTFDGDWQARFTSLIAELEATGKLHALGRLMTRQELLRGLRTRLLLTHARNETPAIADEKIEAPLVITGPPRSGTSILFELLALDPNARAPLAWEVLHPVPFDGATEAARRAMAECEQEFWADVQPEFAAIHELRSDLPVECVTLTLPGFSGGHWGMIANIPNWEADYPATMDYHRALLQTLQHGGPPRNWVLKTPLYLVFIDLLFATYPDAWVVHTHRDPLKTEPSSLSTLATVRWERSDEVELPEAGGAGLGDMMILLAKRRAAGELPDRIVDSHFTELMADPVRRWRSCTARWIGPFSASTPTRSAATSKPSPRASSASTSTRPKSGASIPRALAYRDPGEGEPVVFVHGGLSRTCRRRRLGLGGKSRVRAESTV